MKILYSRCLLSGILTIFSTQQDLKNVLVFATLHHLYEGQSGDFDSYIIFHRRIDIGLPFYTF